MLHFIGGIIAGLIGMLAALFGIGIGFGALLLALAPLILVVLILLLPVLLLVGLLRAIGILSGPFMSLLAIILLIFLMLGGAHHLWRRSTEHVNDWLADKRDELEACQAKGGDANITITGDDMVITCKVGAKPGDAHI